MYCPSLAVWTYRVCRMGNAIDLRCSRTMRLITHSGRMARPAVASRFMRRAVRRAACGRPLLRVSCAERLPPPYEWKSAVLPPAGRLCAVPPRRVTRAPALYCARVALRCFGFLCLGCSLRDVSRLRSRAARADDDDEDAAAAAGGARRRSRCIPTVRLSGPRQLPDGTAPPLS